MLSTIKDFLVGIGDMLMTAWDFVVGIFEDIAYLIKLLHEFLRNIPSYFSWLPASVVALVVAIFGVVVVLRVIGRD